MLNVIQMKHANTFPCFTSTCKYISWIQYNKHYNIIYNISIMVDDTVPILKQLARLDAIT